MTLLVDPPGAAPEAGHEAAPCVHCERQAERERRRDARRRDARNARRGDAPRARRHAGARGAHPDGLRRRAWRVARRTVLAAFLAFSLAVGWSILGALRAPGNDAVPARLAEWARDHHGTPVVNFLERLAYKPPKAGGAPAGGIKKVQAADRSVGSVGSAGGEAAFPTFTANPNALERFPDGTAPPPPGPPKAPPAPKVVGLAPPPPIPVVASPALPDEGQWQVLQSYKGVPVLRAAYVRADSTYTSYVSAVAWMDTKLMGFELRPGSGEPGGGPWAAGASVPPSERADVIAAFNSGFRMADSRGGFYLGGRTAGTMRDNAATVVFDNDGSVKLGKWGSDVGPGPDVFAARQNLDLIVDEGQVNWKIDDNSGNRWGATIGNALYVARSGLGITADGALVYAAGPRLTAATLAQLLIRAGAVRAMELDINPTWTIFVHYTNTADNSVADKLLDSMQRPATTYDSTSSRDFIVAKTRPLP